MTGLTYCDGHFPFCVPLAEEKYPNEVEVSAAWLAAAFWRVKSWKLPIYDWSVNFGAGATNATFTAEYPYTTTTISASLEDSGAIFASFNEDRREVNLLCDYPYTTYNDSTKLWSSWHVPGWGGDYYGPAHIPPESTWGHIAAFAGLSLGVGLGTGVDYLWECYDEVHRWPFAVRQKTGSPGVYYIRTLAGPIIEWEGYPYLNGHPADLIAALRNAGYDLDHWYWNAIDYSVGSVGFYTDTENAETEAYSTWDTQQYYSLIPSSVSAGTITYRINGFPDVVFPQRARCFTTVAGIWGSAWSLERGGAPPDLPPGIGGFGGIDTPPALNSAAINIVCEAAEFWPYGGIYNEDTGEKI